MSGDLPPGERLPTTADLVAEYEAANTTIQKALSILKDEGYVMSHQGKGVYVSDREPFVVEVSPYFAPSPGDFSYELLEVSEVQPPAEVAKALNLPEGAKAVLRKRLMRHEGDPVELDHSYYPLAIVEGSELAGRRRIRGGAPRVLAELGYRQRGFSDRVSTRLPTSEEVELLELPKVPIPVIRQFRTVVSEGAQPVEVNVMIKGGHRYELVYHQDVPEPAS